MGHFLVSTKTNGRETGVKNLQSTVNNGSKAGLYALGSLYFTFAGANFIAPTVAVLLGERIAMLLGAIGYFLFVSANILDHDAKYFLPLFVMGGVMNGLGAAILWTGQGSFITKNSTQETMGRNNGIVRTYITRKGTQKCSCMGEKETTSFFPHLARILKLRPPISEIALPDFS